MTSRASLRVAREAATWSLPLCMARALTGPKSSVFIAVDRRYISRAFPTTAGSRIPSEPAYP